MATALEKLMASLGLDTSEFDQGMDRSEKKAGSFNSFLGGMGNVAAGAAGAVAVVGGAALGAASAIAGMTIKAASGADDLLALSAKTGITVEQLQKLQYASELVDVPVETMTGSLTFLTKAMSAAKDPASEQSSIFKSLGVSIYDANGKLRATNDVWMDAIGALGQVDNQAERDAMSLALFGKSALDLNPLIKAGTNQLAALGDEAVATGYVMSNDAVNALGSVDDAMQRMKNGLTGLTNNLAVIFAPTVSNVLGMVGGYMGKFSAILGDSTLTAGQKVEAGTLLVKSIVSDISGMLPTMMETGLGIIKALISGIVSSIPVLMPTIVDLVISVVMMLTELLPMLADGALQIVSGLANGIGMALPQLIPAIVQMMVSILNAIISNLPTLITAGISILMGLVQGIIGALPQLIAQLPTIILTIVNVLLNNLPMIIEAALQIMMALITGLISAIPQLAMQIPQITFAIISAIIEALPAIIKAGIDLVVGLIKGIGSLLDAIKQAGVNLMTGFWDGLKSMFTRIWDNIVEFVNKIVAKIKNALGIASPSRVFFDIGQNMMFGLANGIDDMVYLPLQSVQKLANGLTMPDLNTAINVNASSSGAASSVRAASTSSEQNGQQTALLQQILSELENQRIFMPQALAEYALTQGRGL
jgi:hypothetical protein